MLKKHITIFVVMLLICFLKVEISEAKDIVKPTVATGTVHTIALNQMEQSGLGDIMNMVN
ncbi:MAG: hypothetical protein KAX49_01530 [Halanaerobiales bacterium]|nr:hypothetical protein [Halanaerobiales bacterium]